MFSLKRITAIAVGVALAATVLATAPAANAATDGGGSSPRVSTSTVRSVALALPKSARVGATVTGAISVSDKTGTAIAPAAGVDVQFQEKRGAQWVTIASGTTDDYGSYLVAFTADVNTTYRPVMTSTTGALVAGKAVSFSAEAFVTWAARPDMDVTGALKSTYAFRVVSIGAPSGYLEYAKASAPNRWFKAKVLASKTDVITQTLVFPAKGSYLVRGTSVATKTTAAGHTSTLSVDVG